MLPIRAYDAGRGSFCREEGGSEVCLLYDLRICFMDSRLDLTTGARAVALLMKPRLTMGKVSVEHDGFFELVELICQSSKF